MRDTNLHLVQVTFKGPVRHPGKDALKASGPKEKERQKLGSFVSVAETEATRWTIDHVEMEEKARRGNIRTDLNTAILKEPEECQLLGPTYLLKKTTYSLFITDLEIESDFYNNKTKN